MQEFEDVTYCAEGITYVFRKCDGTNADFIALCHQLDYELALRAGDEAQRARHSKYNTLDEIRHAFVIYREGQPVGCGAFRRFGEERDTVELKRIFIYHKDRCRGVGSALISNLQSWAAQMGYKRMILETPETMKEAQRLYQRLHFEKMQQYGPYKEMPEAMCMSKKLILPQE